MPCFGWAYFCDQKRVWRYGHHEHENIRGKDVYAGCLPEIKRCRGTIGGGKILDGNASPKSIREKHKCIS